MTQKSELGSSSAMATGLEQRAVQAPAGEKEVVETQSSNKDTVDIARWGKKQQLRRNFSLLSIVALTTTLMETWEGVLGNLASGLTNGGPSGLFYGYFVTWIGVLSQVLVMAEMASMIPLAGGQYNWVALLAPRSCSKFLSYITGWMIVVGWQAGTVTSAYGTGTTLQGVIIQSYPGYVYKAYHGTLLAWATLAFAAFINMYFGRILPTIEGLILILHIYGFFLILIPLVYLGPHGDSDVLLHTFLNTGGWSSESLSFFIGLTTSMVSFIGIDGACHMAEEISNAAVVIPRSMLASVAINGTLGLAMMLAVLFCMGNINDALNYVVPYPVLEIFQQAVGSVQGSAAMSAVLIATNMCSCVGLMASASRMLWAFARERAVPGHSWLSKIERRSRLPLFSIATTAIISALLCLINIGSSVVLQAFLSLTTAGFYSAYLISACVMLHKRLWHPPSSIPWGPFRLGKFGIPVTCFSIVYSAQGVFFSFWPVTHHVTPSTMNWSPVVLGGALLLAMIFWVIKGRKMYKGPIVEVYLE